MKITEEILEFASKQQGAFNKDEVMQHLAHAGLDTSKGYVSLALQNLVKSGNLTRVGWGRYKAPDQAKPVFICNPSEDTRTIYTSLKSRYPNSNFCIWDTDELLPFMHHVPNLHFSIVGCNADLIDFAYDYLSEIYSDRFIVKNPSKEMRDYIYAKRDSIVINRLVTRAPICRVEGISSPTLEKILVDILNDEEFYYLRGDESYYVYKAARDLYNLNEVMLLAYAHRRGKYEEIQEHLNYEGYD